MKLYLSPIECEVLYRKKVKLGMTPIEASKNIKELKDFEIGSNIVRSYNKKEKLRYYFNITGYVNYSKFYRVIGCTSPKKSKEFKLLIKKVKNSKKFKKKMLVNLPLSNNPTAGA